MRAVSLVRAWLYGVRGFVVMTVSLVIAFSVAISGPPTNSEIALVSRAMSAAADAFGQNLETAAVDLCPSLPPEVQPLCGLSPAEQPASPLPQAPSPPGPASTVALALGEPTPAPGQVQAAESQLLGGPEPRVRAERASRRAVTQRASSPRRATTPRASSRANSQRAQTSRRVTNQRGNRQADSPTAAQRAARIRAAQQAAQGDLARSSPRGRDSQPPSTPTETRPTVNRGDDSEHIQAEIERAASIYRDEDENRYASEDDRYHDEQEAREARRRYWREERRRRRYEREYGPPPEEDYYEEEAYPEEERYPDDVW